ncbi:MAG TPA: polysaccharide deacetylase family protein [Candidatus Methylomirabilis sp.]|nr:polysaccharide deacetylase family protein [Candidatus Methylomirabilis sp.]
MACLRKRFHLLSLADFRRHLQDRNPFPANSCLVTIDDGWKDNYTYAYPVMKRYEIPAVIFLSVGHIGTRQRFWQERIISGLHRIREDSRMDPDISARNRNLSEGIKIEELIALPEGKFRMEVREQIRSLKKFPLSRIEPIVHAIEACAGMTGPPSIEGDSFLSWEEIEKMSRGGIDFGSHGLTHEILTNIAADEVRKEALESRRIIEERIQKSVYAFSYPNGDNDPVVRKCIGECGYEIGFGTCRGFAGPDDDPLSLKRVNVHDDMTRDVPMFLSSILGMI